MNQKKNRIGVKFHAILVLLALVLVTMGASKLSSKEVKLVLDGKETVFNTTSNTVSDLLTEKDIKIVENIYLKPAGETQIVNGMEVVVRNPKNVIILDNGVEKTVKTANLLVGDILAQYDYNLKDQDYTIPSIDEQIKLDGDIEPVIIINRLYQKTLTEVVAIPYDLETRDNPELEKGKSKIIQEGVDGSKIVTTGITVENEVEKESHLISEEIVKKPISRIIEVGTKVVEEKKEVPVAEASPSVGKGSLAGKKIKKVLTMRASAYDASFESNGKWAGITALGTKLRPGVVAVDKRVIPLGSKLYIESTDGWPSYGMAVAEDVGGAIKGDRIDLFFPSAQTCRNFGRRTVKVYVLEP